MPLSLEDSLVLNQSAMEQLLSPSTMSEESRRNLIHDSLVKLRCHFTWELVIKDVHMPDLEAKILETLFLDTNYNMGMHNLLAYVRHLKGEKDEALQSLKEAEALIQGEKLDKRSLVTWGNCAWVYYHRGDLAEAQNYLDKVENVCKEFASPFRYRMECAEIDCEEGWALLKCGGTNYTRAMACFAKALQVEPENPEYNTGYAIVAYYLDLDDNYISLEPLRKAVRLSPEDPHLKVLLALKLQESGKTDEAEEYIEEALRKISPQKNIFGYVAQFYRRKGCVEEALKFLETALQSKPSSPYLHFQIGLCHKRRLFQIKEATNMRPKGKDREIADQSIRSAISYFKKTLDLKPTYDRAYVDLAEMYAENKQYEEAEETFQKVLDMMSNLNVHVQQEIHLRYGKFQQFHMQSDNKAITHYLKGLKIEAASTSVFYGKLLKALQKLAERRIQQNVHVLESLSLLGFVYRLKGDTSEAMSCYEKALRLTEKLNPEF